MKGHSPSRSSASKKRRIDNRNSNTFNQDIDPKKKSKNCGVYEASLSSGSKSNPLRGLCVCLTGLTAKRKAELHCLVESLGGRYTRDLVTQQTTHLIAERPEGEKYAQAAKCSHIEIVTPKWLVMCAERQMRLSTADFSLQGVDHDKTNVIDASDLHLLLEKSSKGQFSLGDKLCSIGAGAIAGNSLLEKSMEEILVRGNLPPNPLFSGCCFYLIGFPLDGCGNNHDQYQSKPNSDRKEGNNLIERASTSKANKDLCKLIRRCMGTIFWNVNTNISHVIVNEDCDLKTRNDVSNFCRYHPNSPIAISPEWVIACVQKKQLIDGKDFPPRKRVTTLKAKKKTVQSPVRNVLKSQMFNGVFFQILQSVDNEPTSTGADANDFVSFNSEKVEKLITSHGGQILSKEGIRILKKSPANTSAPKNQNRKCYIVHVSGVPFQLEKTIRSDVLLNHISHHKLCEVIPVNVIWLQACEGIKMETDPYHNQELFVPQTVPIRKLHDDIKLKVAVTGFMGAKRLGMKYMLLAIGAIYTENMGNKNTHLICKESSGRKYDKALEWGLHVVTEGWLHHIVEHGYKDKCEDPYSLVPPKEEEEAKNSQDTTIFSSQDY